MARFGCWIVMFSKRSWWALANKDWWIKLSSLKRCPCWRICQMRSLTGKEYKFTIYAFKIHEQNQVQFLFMPHLVYLTVSSLIYLFNTGYQMHLKLSTSHMVITLSVRELLATPFSSSVRDKFGWPEELKVNLAINIMRSWTSLHVFQYNWEKWQSWYRPQVIFYKW